MVLVQHSGDMRSAEDLRNAISYVVMDASDWRIIPAENLVAAFQVKLLAPEDSSSDHVAYPARIAADLHKPSCMLL